MLRHFLVCDTPLDDYNHAVLSTLTLTIIEIRNNQKETNYDKAHITVIITGSKVNVDLYSALSCRTSKAFRYGPCVTRGSHSFTCHPHTNRTCFTPQPQGIAALWPVPTDTAW